MTDQPRLGPIDHARTANQTRQTTQAGGRHTVDSITSDALDQLYATVQRLTRRAQAAESENAVYRRAIAQWDVSDRGTYIPHASLVAIGRAAGTDVLGSVRHLKHFERVEQAEAALAAFKDRIEAITDEARGGIRQQLGDALAALDPQEPQT